MSEWGGTLFCAAGELSLVESKGVFCERITLDSASATKYSRAKGSYITLRCENFAALLSRQNTLARAIAAELVRFLPKSGRVLVAGLGNRALIADAVGPLTIAELPPLPRIMLAETGVPKKRG